MPGHAAVAAWIGMSHVAQTLEQAVTALLAEHGLNPGQYDVLMNVVAVEGLTQQELAARLCHSKANVSQLVSKMERGGLLRRVPHGRAYRLYPTDLARSLIAQVGPQLEQRIAARFATLTEHEREELRRMVEKLPAGGG
ncbi:MAG: MarR family winged helix-turn-helix transcriptional regulator [Thermomicrobiales bacterium]